MFSITTSGTYQVLYSFAGSPNDGQYPYSSLINVNGVLYGTTASGGAHNAGTVFGVTTAGSEGVVYSFGSREGDGDGPYGPLVNVNGVLYGTTNQNATYKGSTNDYGTVFKVTLSGAERVLYRFTGGSDGALPFAGLTNVNGTLYGTTSSGGTSGLGTVFSITKSGTESVVYSFAGDPDGSLPYSGLTNVNGVLYGTTNQGGTSNNGAVFSIVP